MTKDEAQQRYWAFYEAILFFCLIAMITIGMPGLAASASASRSAHPDESGLTGTLSLPSGDDIPCLQDTSGGRIKDIYVRGAFPVFEKNIINAMTIHAGSVLDRNVISAQQTRIIAYLKQQGFLDPSAVIHITSDPADHNYWLHIDIHTDGFRHLKQLYFSGNHSFSAIHLKSIMSIWRMSLMPGVSGRLIDDQIQKDLQKISGLYWRSGYLDMQSEFSIIPRPENPLEVDLKITLTEGPCYRFKWEGNHFFSDRELKKDLVFLTEGKMNDTSTARSVHKIQNRYRQAGFLDPEVNIHQNSFSSGESNSGKTIFIQIQEGPRTLIDRIQIQGNSALPVNTIEKQILSRPKGLFQQGALVRETLDEDIQSITSLYFSKGYQDAEISPDIELSQDKTRAAVSVKIQEGDPTLVSGISISGLHAVSLETAGAALSLKTGHPFNKDMLDSDRNTLTEMISETGHPHVLVLPQAVFTENASRVAIEFSVDEGPYVVMGNVEVVGNFTTREQIIKNEMEIRAGEPFSLKKLLQSQKNIRSMEMIRSVRFRSCGLKEKSARVDLIIEVEEVRPYLLDAGIGYESEKGAFAHTRLEDRNLFGSNDKAWTEIEVSQIGYRAETGLTDPRFFGTRFAADLSMYSEDRSEFNQGFGIRILGSSVAFSRKWGDGFSAGLSFGAEQRTEYENPNSTIQTYWVDNISPNTTEPRSLMIITPKLQYDTRDSFIRPRKGFFAAAYTDFSEGLDGNLLDDFLRYRTDMRAYYSPWNRLTLAGAARWGYIESLNPGNIIADDQLFYLGGSANVRGFDENMLRYNSAGTPVGGQTSTSGTLEGRIDLGNDFELSLFVDSGSLSRYQVDDIPEGFRTSAGLGLRYITPIGPIGFAYGFKLNPEPGEDLGRLHFSIGYTF